MKLYGNFIAKILLVLLISGSSLVSRSFSQHLNIADKIEVGVNFGPTFFLGDLGGNLTLVGAPDKPLPVSSLGLVFGRRSISGSLIGGLPETQEMLDFCGKHNITSDVEVIPIQKVNEAYDRLLKSDVKYRFSIDMESLRTE